MNISSYFSLIISLENFDIKVFYFIITLFSKNDLFFKANMILSFIQLHSEMNPSF